MTTPTLRFRRVAVLAAGLGAALAGLLAGPAAPAQAHPLGNFSVNQYAGLTLHPGRIDVIAVADTAEIPTLQEKPRVDTDGDGTLSAAERAGYATAECGRFAGALVVSVDGDRLVWTVSDPSYDVTPGAAGLEISRLACRLTAPARLAAAATVRVDNGYRSGRVGWRELTAKGDGVRLDDPPVPAESISGQLRSYPRDLLASAPDVRGATIRTAGALTGADGGGAATGAPAMKVPGPDWLAAAQNRVESVLGGHLTPVVIGLAFLLALLLGAGHAALPGHGKTVMAAYFAGRRGRIRDALAVGGTVTLAHTGGVLLVGLLLSTSTALAGERVLAWLGAASGLLVVAVGVGMLVSARRARREAPHDHTHGPQGHAQGSESHSHSRERHTHGPDVHSHGRDNQTHGRDSHFHDAGDAGHAHGDSTTHAQQDAGHAHGGHHHHHGTGRQGRPGGRLGLAGIGLAGGLVPSPSALVVLLGAIGLGRTGLGVLLVLAYGLGMAGTLTAVGLLLVVAQNRLGRLIARGGRAARVSGLLSRAAGRISASAPTATAALVVLVGLGMGVRAVA